MQLCAEFRKWHVMEADPWAYWPKSGQKLRDFLGKHRPARRWYQFLAFLVRAEPIRCLSLDRKFAPSTTQVWRRYAKMPV